MDKKTVVSHYFMAKSINDKRNDFTNKKLQKLIFYAQAWSLVLNKERLITDRFQAWIHGAAIPSLYGKYKVFSYKQIEEEFDEREFDSLTKKEKRLLNEVWDVYGKYDPDYLEVLNHNEEPWQKARQNISPFTSSKSIISEKDMEKYYGAKLKGTKKKA